MQTIHRHQPKPASKPHVAKDALGAGEARRKHQKSQPSGLTREEIRQIVIDMIG
jgi:hypothetical protein